MRDPFGYTGLTYDDVLLLPGESDVIPSEVDTTSRFTKNISLHLPFASAAMDTVTESRMAIAMARHGGIGILHRNLSIEDQAHQVDLVKRTQTGRISNPITIGPDATLEELDRVCGQFRVSGLPVVDPAGKLLGICTNRDLRFTPVAQWATTKVRDIMTPQPLFTAPENVSSEEATALLRKNKRERLPLVDARLKATQRGEVAIEAVKTLPTLIKDWKTNRDLIYQHLGCVAGILTIAAYVCDQRPSEVLADLFNAAGMQRIGAWLESGLPPFLAQPDTHSNHVLVQLAGVAVVLMLVMPFFNARRNESYVDAQAMGLLGARAASTTWILLVIAVQLGSLQWGIDWLRSMSWALGVIMAFGSVALLLVYTIARKLWMQDLLVPVGRGLSWMITRGSAVAAMATFALIFVVIGPALGLGTWLLSTESDAHYETQRRIAQRRAEREAPTGAKPTT
ncbi:IMP dehydrogenase [Dermabacteraceae bacterium P13101]